MIPRFTAAPHLFDYSKGYHSGQILNEWLAWIARFTAAPHLFDYSKGYHSGQILNEWLAWIGAMAPFDNGMYD